MNVYKTYIALFAFVAILGNTEKAEAQTKAPQTLHSIQVSYKDTARGRTYLFITEAPASAKTWQLSVAEHNGISIFSDAGENWDVAGYAWIPDKTITLHSGIFYIVTLSFVSESNEVLATKSSKFFTTVEITDNKTPLIFFRGNTIIYSSSLYNENTGGITGLLDFIAEQSNNQYKENSILVRGHAAFVTHTREERKREQIELLALSSKRALKIIEELVKRNVDSQRIVYEVLGGSENLSKNPKKLWKNRRVEIVFMPKERTAYMKEKMNKDTDIQETNTPLTTQLKREPIPQQKSKERHPDQKIHEENFRKTSRENKITTTNEIEIPPTLPQQNEQIEPWPDTPIMSKGTLTANDLAAFLLYNVPALHTEYARRIASFYLLEAARENVNQDIAFVQMLLETDYLQFTGIIQKNQYNFANIGTVANRKESNWFSTETIGIRAHIQHLKGYASTKPLNGNLVDPRYPILEQSGLLGSSPLASTLSGRWSADLEYGTKILRIMRRMYNFADAWNKTSAQ